MLNQDYADDSLQMILDELSKESAQPSLVPAKIENHEIEHLDREQLEDYIIKKYASRKIYYQQADIYIDTEKENPDEVISKLYHHEI